MKAQTTFLMVVARQGNTGVRPCAEEGISSADDNPCLPQCMSLSDRFKDANAMVAKPTSFLELPIFLKLVFVSCNLNFHS
ncbi:unnamed protein product [Rhodiola kirilowii]